MMASASNNNTTIISSTKTTTSTRKWEKVPTTLCSTSMLGIVHRSVISTAPTPSYYPASTTSITTTNNNDHHHHSQSIIEYHHTNKNNNNKEHQDSELEKSTTSATASLSQLHSSGSSNGSSASLTTPFRIRTDILTNSPSESMFENSSSASTPVGDDSGSSTSASTRTNATSIHSNEPHVCVVDPHSRKLEIPRSYLRVTQALNRVGIPSLCMLYLSGRCRAGSLCHQAHVDADLIDSLRREALIVPTCCFEHGDVHSRKLPKLVQQKVSGRTCEFWLNGRCIPTERLAMTLGLERLLAASLDQEDDNSVQDDVEEEEKATTGQLLTSSSHDENDSSTSSHTLHQRPIPPHTVQLASRNICRLHLANRCRYVEECNHVHMCRTFFSSPLPAAAAANAPYHHHAHTMTATTPNKKNYMTTSSINRNNNNNNNTATPSQHQRSTQSTSSSSHKGSSSPMNNNNNKYNNNNNNNNTTPQPISFLEDRFAALSLPRGCPPPTALQRTRRDLSEVSVLPPIISEANATSNNTSSSHHHHTSRSVISNGSSTSCMTALSSKVDTESDVCSSTASCSSKYSQSNDMMMATKGISAASSSSVVVERLKPQTVVAEPTSYHNNPYQWRILDEYQYMSMEDVQSLILFNTTD